MTVASLACSSVEGGDEGVTREPNPIGSGLRIRDVGDPANGMAGTEVNVTGAIVIAVDTFDETRDGKSRGTVYVQDVGGVDPYSGVSLYAPAFVPANLRVAPGDVLDLRGRYVQLGRIGGANFGANFLPQIERPAAEFRYEFAVPKPLEVDVSELDDFETGRKWLNMLVTVKSPSLRKNLVECPPGSGRVVAPISDATEGAGDCPRDRKGVTMTNELFDLKPGSVPANTELRSITGVVTWFFNFHIAPRSAADIKE